MTWELGLVVGQLDTRDMPADDENIRPTFLLGQGGGEFDPSYLLMPTPNLDRHVSTANNTRKA